MIYQKKAIANKDITLSLLNTINLDPDNDLKIIELIEKTERLVDWLTFLFFNFLINKIRV